MDCSSPHFVRLSRASDILLGFSYGKFYRNAYPLTINILLHFSEGCAANCLYCGQARSATIASAACRTLIRVDWPLRPLSEVVERISKITGSGSSFRPYRVCVSDIEHPRAVGILKDVVRTLWSRLGIPISALISPTQFSRKDMEELKTSGVERIGIALDCASEELFDILRGSGAGSPHRWGRYMEGIRDAVETVGRGRVGVHLIVGLGESEEDAVRLIQLVHEMGAETHLFSFYPERSTILEGWLRPPASQYRRVQLARYLINNNLSRYEWMEFDSMRRIVDFGLPKSELEDIIESGLPFVTAGCPGCNRPYANERPGELPRNFPYIPRGREIEKIKQQLHTYLPVRNSIHNLRRYLDVVSVHEIRENAVP
ncbi:MAG: radical SAM protein [Ignisphaera sp.]|nr:radical SAM protein [Ignisphaera sp.]MDW8085582.1 radical SAM protein [Ignisphaera sp.]